MSDNRTAATSTEQQSLTDFLLARIAEDEAVALGADNCEAWECAESCLSWQVQTVAAHGSPGYAEKTAVTMDQEGLSDSVSPGDGAHIARWHPTRVLAECEAKRRAIEVARLYGCEKAIVGYLALPYADHLDYRDEWRP